jgi:MtN3 and saliva related transmembrane protein
MDYITIIGLCAASLTTISFLPQAIKVWKLKETRDLSLIMFISFSIGVLLWLVYGIIKKDLALILANSITLILSSVILFFKLKYK